MKINEIFWSVQGEGRYIGHPAIFIRTYVCHLVDRGIGCEWCDTPHSWTGDNFKEMTPEIIAKVIECYPTKHIVLTGGEPYLQQDLKDVVTYLKNKDYFIEIETTGDCNFKRYHPIQQYNISPKYQQCVLHWNIDFHYEDDTILKFVYDGSGATEDFIATVIKTNDCKKENVYIMPECRTREQYYQMMAPTVNYCKKTGYVFAPRLHIINWGNKKGV